MIKASIAFAAAALMLTAVPSAREAQAGHASFSYRGPGVSVYVGPRYRYRPYSRPYYRPYRYRPYPYVYRPPAPDRCGYWSGRCAQNWGYGNRNYYGCMRYHGC